MEKSNQQKLIEELEKMTDDAPMSHWFFGKRMLEVVKEFLIEEQDDETK